MIAPLGEIGSPCPIAVTALSQSRRLSEVDKHSFAAAHRETWVRRRRAFVGP